MNKNNNYNEFQISYKDEKAKEYDQLYKDIVFRFKMANIRYIFKCIFTLRIDKLIPKKKSEISINDLTDSIDKKIEELEQTNTNESSENDYEAYFYTRLLTLNKKNYNLWKNDVSSFIETNKSKWNTESKLIYEHTPFMPSEKHKNWLYYITGIIEKLSDKNYDKFIADPKVFIDKNLDKFNYLTKV